MGRYRFDDPKEAFLEARRLIRRATQIGQTILDLGGLGLTAVPESLGHLTQLEKLGLYDNRLMTLPISLAQLDKLESLWLQNNQLTALPESLRALTGLRELFLHDNDALSLPAEILGPREADVTLRRAKAVKPSDILDYYFRTRAGQQPLNEAKLILVGRGGVGKTSLVNRLLRDSFDPTQAKTEGIAISEWILKLGNDDVRLNLWDFGGQEIMHATHQFFLTQRSLYLLVLEGRQGVEDADAEYWLKLIASFGAEDSGDVSPVLIVLNKSKLCPFDLNRRALRRKYPFVQGFITTDCQDGAGIDELRDTIERETDQLKHLRDAFPASWFAIKDELAKMEDNFISFERYRDLCAEAGEKETKAQDSLALHLHNLGISLNYKDDPRLRDMHVLNPHWITNGIYAILNAPLLSGQKGELHLSQLTKILRTKDYPRKMHAFLFDLMKKFELCFAFPDDDTHYLIPELLDKQEAGEAGEFQGAECLNFEYRYTVLPEGLLPRFIVRTHVLSTELPRWRTGVILTFEGNRALVKADVQDKRVCIAINGPMAGRRRLLAVIRSDLERIHGAINKLNPEAMVPVPGYADMAVRYAKLLALELKGIRTFHEEWEGDIIELNVQELLNGVDLDGTRQPGVAVREKVVRLFYSYAHKDETLRNELETHLKILERLQLIAPWHDRRIIASEEWKGEIDENLEQADIILLLVSADFIASDYCWDKEMTRALERHETGEATVVPVIIRDVNWTDAPFAKLQALPKDGKPVTKWTNRDSAWKSVSKGIERAAKRTRQAGRP